MTTVPGKLFNGVFRRVLVDDLTPAMQAQLLAIGLDVSVPLAGEHPKSLWQDSIDTTATALFASNASPLRSLGRHIVVSLESRNLIKGPWLTMARLLGPKRALKQAAQNADAAFPISFDLKDVGSKEVEVTSSESEQTEFLAGLLEGLVTLLRGKDVAVSVASVEPAKAVFRIAWR